MGIIKKIISIAFKVLRIVLIVGIPVLIIIYIWLNYKKELDLALSIRNQGEVTYLVLFQNTLELRPTGGFIGNFAEVTLKDGRVKDYTIYNTNVFDYGKPGVNAPEPIKKMLGIQEMQLRDANWSPNFPTVAKQVIELYKLEGGVEDISGVIAVNASILPEMLKILGPVSINSIDYELTAENILLKLQYELNFGFLDKGISRGDRKEPIKDLAFEIDNKISTASIFKLYRIGNMLLEQANQKQILFWNKDNDIQSKITKLNWAGEINLDTSGIDYFMLVDANLGALKTDYYMKRSVSKNIRECEDKICSNIVITYTNAATAPSPLNNEYKSYTRVLLPFDAYINSVSGIEKRPIEIDYTTMYNKKVAGFEINIPFNSSKAIVLDYSIPKLNEYNLELQKQSGIEGFEFTLDNQIDNKKTSEFIKSDWSLKN
jgi:hypothetical protein